MTARSMRVAHRSVLQRVDRRQVAALLVVVHAVAEHVAVRHFERRRSPRTGPARSGRARFTASAAMRTSRAPCSRHQSRDRGQRVAFVEDVVDQQHAAAAQRRRRAVLPRQFAAGGRAAVAGGVQVVEFQVEPARAEFQRQLRRRTAGRRASPSGTPARCRRSRCGCAPAMRAIARSSVARSWTSSALRQRGRRGRGVASRPSRRARPGGRGASP